MSNIVELTLDLPLSITKDETQTLLAVKLYETGKVSLGKAAEIAGFSIRAFIELLSKHNVSVIDYSPDDLREEMEN